MIGWESSGGSVVCSGMGWARMMLENSFKYSGRWSVDRFSISYRCRWRNAKHLGSYVRSTKTLGCSTTHCTSSRWSFSFVLMDNRRVATSIYACWSLWGKFTSLNSSSTSWCFNSSIPLIISPIISCMPFWLLNSTIFSVNLPTIPQYSSPYHPIINPIVSTLVSHIRTSLNTIKLCSNVRDLWWCGLGYSSLIKLCRYVVR